MNKYAYIINDRVSCVVSAIGKNRKLKKKETETVVEITDLDPMPDKGWRYNSSDGMFLPQEDMTEAEFEEFDSKLTAEYSDSETCAECRKDAYAEIEGQLEMICETFGLLRDQGIDIGESGDRLISCVDEIKEAHPKQMTKIIYPRR